MGHQEHFFQERMPAVFTSSKSTVIGADKLNFFVIMHQIDYNGNISLITFNRSRHSGNALGAPNCHLQVLKSCVK